ncbi:MAG: OsmC family protein [Bacteroidia bacterium]|nr:OsmC family protein [Bacteroidia bacterium]
MKIVVERKEEKFVLEARNEQGNTLIMDADEKIGGKGKGMRPMQLLLAAAGGCSSIDVLLILSKQKQEVKSYKVEVEGEKEKVEDHSEFRDIRLSFYLEGNIDPQKALNAVRLSVEKYCSVSKTLEKTAKVSYAVFVNGKEVK